MAQFTPRGYARVPDVLDAIGRELFGADWTGEEHREPATMLRPGEQPARGSDARGSGSYGAAVSTPCSTGPRRAPDEAAYAAWEAARGRVEQARLELRSRLEAGDLEAAILDWRHGGLHRASRGLWRRHDAGSMLDKGEAPIPHRNTRGSILIAWTPPAPAPASKRPFPAGRLPELVEFLRAMPENVTRPEQKERARRHYHEYELTERLFQQAFQPLRRRAGRKPKS